MVLVDSSSIEIPFMVIDWLFLSLFNSGDLKISLKNCSQLEIEFTKIVSFFMPSDARLSDKFRPACNSSGVRKSLR